MVLLFTGTYFLGDRNDRISRIRHGNAGFCCKNPQNCLDEFSNMTFFANTNFRKFCPKPRKSIPVKINANKVSLDGKLL